MIIESLFIGLVVGFLFYELAGVSPGGVIAPGYFALYIQQPGKILITVIIAMITWAILEFLARHLIIYGRRRLLVALLIGFCLKIIVESVIQPMPVIGIDLQSIGYIIPGLIANELSRQRVLPTLSSLGFVTVCVYLILLLL
ncbi:MAG: poly-gamma-glutamate biosynthesis protein PgsC [bacterium]